MLANASTVRSLAIAAAICTSVAVALVLFTRHGQDYFLPGPRPYHRPHGDHHADSPLPPPPPPPPLEDALNVPAHDSHVWAFDHTRDGRNYGLNKEQCLAAFPRLYQEIERAVEHRQRKAGKITEDELDVGWRGDGITRAMVFDNQLYIVDPHNIGDHNHRPRAIATMNAINRAVSAAQEPLPNVEFTFTDHDSALFVEGSNHTTWAYTRLPDQDSLWLMPDFGFWGWPNVGLRSYAEFQSILEATEADFQDKVPKIVWRGALNVAASSTRNGLVRHSKGREWSDVRVLDWSNKTNIHENLISMDDHCAYMFVAGTEGNTYSGRLKYLLNCHSIMLSHKLKWLEHYHHLLQASGPDQNYIELKRDFSDLPKAMAAVLDGPGGVEGAQFIADNAVRVFRQRYLTPAAEACYWRALIRGWASVQDFEVQRYKTVDVDGKPTKKLRGAPFEAFAIMEEVDWAIPARPRKMVVDGG